MTSNNKIEPLQCREMDETWDMNTHINPMDEEAREQLARHKGILMNNSDDFVSYIKHTESK